MKVCVFAPYGRNEITAAALRVADLSLAYGNDTRFIAAPPRENVIHHYWDSRAVGNRPHSIYTAARGADRCVWFVDNARMYADAHLVANRAEHTLVPCAHAMHITRKGIDTKRFASMICPSRTCSTSLRMDVFGGEFPLPTTWALFDSGLPFVCRRGHRSGYAVVVLCDTTAIDESGPQILRVVTDLLGEFTDLRITLLCVKSWSRRLRREIRCLLQDQPRLSVVYQRSWLQQIEVIHQHDIAVILSVRADFGINVMRCLSCSVPVAAYNIPPFNELISPGTNGWLIKCETVENSIGAMIALPNTVNILTTMSSALVSDIDDLRNNSWRLDDAATAFERVWCSILN